VRFGISASASRHCTIRFYIRFHIRPSVSRYCTLHNPIRNPFPIRFQVLHVAHGLGRCTNAPKVVWMRSLWEESRLWCPFSDGSAERAFRMPAGAADACWRRAWSVDGSASRPRCNAHHLTPLLPMCNAHHLTPLLRCFQCATRIT
jgi:hypothetical protein